MLSRGSAMAASTYAACLTGRIAFDHDVTVLNRGGLVRARATEAAMVTLHGNATWEWDGVVTVEEGKPFETQGLKITPIEVNHPVLCTGLLIDDGEVSLAFTSDTYKTDRFWAEANRLKNLRAIFVDVSFPSTEEGLAERSGHLTPASLYEEMSKIEGEPTVYAVHIKPFFRTSRGSANELTTALMIARARGFISAEELATVETPLDRVRAMLWRLTR